VPFHGIKGRHLVISIVDGTRPTKPEDAAAIGLSDPLWKLLQACWSGNRALRPRMQGVEDQVGDAAAGWGTQMPYRGPVPFPLRPEDSQNTSVIFPDSSPTDTRNSSASDLPRLNTPVIRVVGPDENNSHPIQEYPSPSPNPSGSSSDETLINHLDSVSF